MPPKAQDFREALYRWLDEAERQGDSFLEVKAGELHQAVGGYPGADARMPNCCSVMRSVLREKGGVIVHRPPKGNGASLTIRYRLSPRAISPEDSRMRNSEARNDRQLSQAPIDQDIYLQLVSIAEAKGTIAYQELASVKSLTMDSPEDRTRLATLLGEISIFEHKNGRPLLSVVVVNKSRGLPGRGFFQLAKRIGTHDGKDDLAFFVSELNKVYEYWAGSLSEISDESKARSTSKPTDADSRQVDNAEPSEPKLESNCILTEPGSGSETAGTCPDGTSEAEPKLSFLGRMWHKVATLIWRRRKIWKRKK